MVFKKPKLIVVRDGTQVRETSCVYNHHRVLSVSEFFAKIRWLAFFYHPNRKLSKGAVALFSQAILLSQTKVPLFWSKNLATLYTSIFHGVSTPKEILAGFKNSKIAPYEEIVLCQKLHEKMQEHNLICPVESLLVSANTMGTMKVIPPFLLQYSEIFLLNLVDLTNLELHIIKTLASLGVSIQVQMPFDANERGINTGINYIAKNFEADYVASSNIELNFYDLSRDNPLKHLCDNIFKEQVAINLPGEVCTIKKLENQKDEVKFVAQKIIGIKEKDPHAKIAVVVRSIDKRARLYKEMLLQYGIHFKDRKGQPLLETSGGVLLSLLMTAFKENLLESQLKGLLLHPLFAHALNFDEPESQCLCLLNEMDISLTPQKGNRYEEPFLKAQKIHQNDSWFQENLAILEKKVGAINQILQNWKPHDSMGGYLKALERIVEESFIKNDKEISLKILVDSLNTLNIHCDLPPEEIPASVFFTFILDFLGKVTVPREDYPDDTSVEILLIPEVLGRDFHHIFFVDMAFGRVPQSVSLDPFFPDKKRLVVNKVTQKQVLRIFFDDPYEISVSPPRQSLEPFWFVSAMASSSVSLCFSFAKTTFKGEEQVESDYFSWLEKHVSVSEAKRESYFVDEREYLFSKKEKPMWVKEAFFDREQYVTKGQIGAYAFWFNPNLLNKSLKNRVFSDALHPLTPTFIESFAECRYLGLLKKSFHMGGEKKNLDVKNQVLGQLAHKALEKYFDNHKRFNDVNHKENYLYELLMGLGNQFFDKDPMTNKPLFFCYLEFLFNLLKGLIPKFLETPDYSLIAREVAIGLGRAKTSAVKIRWQNRDYFIAGVVDRLDKKNDTFVITDYKYSSQSTVLANVAAQNLCTTHFQMPVYTRLVGEKFNSHNLDFSFVSIKDGSIFKNLKDFTQKKQFISQVFEDDSPQSLACGVDKVMAPLRDGQANATAGQICSFCDYKYICRVSK